MTNKKTRSKAFIETSAAIWLLHGHSLQKQAVAKAIHNKNPWSSWFVRREYVNSFIIGLIELYFVIRDEETVDDAMIRFSEQAGFRPRKLQLAFRTIHLWLTSQEDHQAKGKTLRRLGNRIVSMLWLFDETFSRRISDHLKCTLGKNYFKKESFSEQMLLEFFERHDRIRQSVPSCTLCGFKRYHDRLMDRDDIDLFSEGRENQYKKNTGYAKQAQRLRKLAESPTDEPRCSVCDRVGDSIIAASICRKKHTLVTVDRAFDAFGEILSFEVDRMPSLASIKRDQANSS